MIFKAHTERALIHDKGMKKEERLFHVSLHDGLKLNFSLLVIETTVLISFVEVI
jgi:hypothetical protein